jgi:hypothetical protein
MKSHTTSRFRKSLAQLPKTIQRQAREAYLLFIENPYHPSLRFKQLHPTLPIYSVRISINYRAVGMREGDTVIWFWAGSHDDYQKLLSRM